MSVLAELSSHSVQIGKCKKLNLPVDEKSPNLAIGALNLVPAPRVELGTF